MSESRLTVKTLAWQFSIFWHIYLAWQLIFKPAISYGAKTACWCNVLWFVNTLWP